MVGTNIIAGLFNKYIDKVEKGPYYLLFNAESEDPHTLFKGDFLMIIGFESKNLLYA
jgi:hypothetical protein